MELVNYMIESRTHLSANLFSDFVQLCVTFVIVYGLLLFIRAIISVLRVFMFSESNQSQFEVIFNRKNNEQVDDSPLYSTLFTYFNSHLKHNWLVQNRNNIQFTYTSSLNKGIRLLITVRSSQMSAVKRILSTHIQDIEFKNVRKYSRNTKYQYTTYGLRSRGLDTNINTNSDQFILSSLSNPKRNESYKLHFVLQPKTNTFLVSIQKTVRKLYTYYLFKNNLTNIPEYPSFNIRSYIELGTNNKSNFNERKKEILASLNNFRSARFIRVPNFIWTPFISNMNIPVKNIEQVIPFNTFASSHVDNIHHSLFRTLQAPSSIKGSQKFDIQLGINTHHSNKTTIGLQKSDRDKHMYIIGATGSGKTTLLYNLIVQDIKNNRGLAVIDPHGDLAQNLLSVIPNNRIEDVIYFNPDDLDYPISINLLEIPDNLTTTELLHEKDLITESVVSIFRKIFSEDDSGGHRIEYILRNTIHTALYTEGPTLFTVYKILTNKTYRNEIIDSIEDDHLKDFWLNEFGKAGDYQRVKMSAGITAKLGRFLFSASASKILENPHSTINFDDIISSNKICICNISKGRLGDDTSSLFGSLLLAKIQIATLRKARIKEQDRSTFYLYVDEFQNFATTSFVQLLSEARKYKLSVIMAEQSTAQQSDPRLNEILLANAGVIISFRTASNVDERVMLPLYTPYIKEGDLSYLPAYTFYMRILGKTPEPPLSVKTVFPIKTNFTDREERLIGISRAKYCVKLPIINGAEALQDIDDYEVDVPYITA